MTMDDFQRFEEEEMMQQMHMMNRDDSRFRGPMDPRMLAMMARDPKSMPGMPPMALMEHLSQMERPMGDGDHQAWDAEYERMLQAPPGAAKPDDAMFAMMEREFGRTAIRPGPAGPLPGPQLIRGPTPRDWAAEFDQESKFAEFERVYRTSTLDHALSSTAPSFRPPLQDQLFYTVRNTPQVTHNGLLTSWVLEKRNLSFGLDLGLRALSPTLCTFC
jgi:hypothetical protein